MNIIDLCWCTFYRHEERYDIGIPSIGASIAVVIVLGLYALGIIAILRTFVLDHLPHLDKWHFFVILTIAVFVVFFIGYRTKELRARKLHKYDEYNKSHPRKRLLRFWLFVSFSILFYIASIVVMNIRYGRIF